MASGASSLWPSSAWANRARSPTVEYPPPAEVPRYGSVSVFGTDAVVPGALVYAIDRSATASLSGSDPLVVIPAGA